MQYFDFEGSRYELNQAVKKHDGVMDTDSHFHCIQRIHDGHKTSGICFRFDCTVIEKKAGFHIRYRVRPTIGTLFLPVMLLLVLAACIVASAIYGESWLYSGIFSALVIISTTMLFVLRRSCIRRFTNTFRKQHTKKKHN